MLMADQLHGQVVTESDLQLEGEGLESWPGHTENFKIEPIANVLIVWCSA